VSSKAVREAILQRNEINVVGEDMACHKKKRKIGSENIDQRNLRRFQLTMEKRRRQEKKEISGVFLRQEDGPRLFNASCRIIEV
jgi:hypothetical protein